MLSDSINYHLGQYALFESHISYMYEPCYNFIAEKIYEILYDFDLFKEYSAHPQIINTGYFYSVSKYNCVDASKATKEDLPIRIEIKSYPFNNFVFGAVENTGQKEIRICINVAKLGTVINSFASWFDNHKMKFLYRVDKIDEYQKKWVMRYLLAMINHEFVHIRQQYTKKRTGEVFNAISEQLDSKSLYLKVIEESNLTDEEKELFKYIYYLFTETEMDARISSTGYILKNNYSVDEIREEAIEDNFKFLKKENSRNYSDDELMTFAEMQQRNVSYSTIETCIRLTYDQNDFDDYQAVYAQLLSVENYKKKLETIDSKLHFFRHSSIDALMKEYKKKLIDTIYKVLVDKGYNININESVFSVEYGRQGSSIVNDYVSTHKGVDNVFYDLSKNKLRI